MVSDAPAFLSLGAGWHAANNRLINTLSTTNETPRARCFSGPNDEKYMVGMRSLPNLPDSLSKIDNMSIRTYTQRRICPPGVVIGGNGKSTGSGKPTGSGKRGAPRQYS